MKRFRPRAKGRVGNIKPYSSVTIILSEIKNGETWDKRLIQ